MRRVKWRARSASCAVSSPHLRSTRACESSLGCRSENLRDHRSRANFHPSLTRAVVRPRWLLLADQLDHPSEKPWGTGEPSAAVVPSAISNAVFDATRVRLRSVPFTPEKVRETLRRGA